jgi:hypothetical protein
VLPPNLDNAKRSGLHSRQLSRGPIELSVQS